MYFGFLLFSLTGLLYADYKKELVIFSSKRINSIFSILISLVAFLVIDEIGVILQIFKSNPKWLIGIEILPGVPIEELFFLILISYFSLVLWKIIGGKK